MRTVCPIAINCDFVVDIPPSGFGLTTAVPRFLISSKRMCLWHGVDSEGEVLESRSGASRQEGCAERMRKPLKKQGYSLAQQ